VPDQLSQVGVGAVSSVGSVGDAFDNALAETEVGQYKTELIHYRGSWRGLDDVELAALEWVDWHTTAGCTAPATIRHQPRTS
jgi:transposase InsO family protein